MTDTETTTTDTDPTTEETATEAAGAPSLDEMCRGFAEMGAQMMSGGMQDCCRPGASVDAGGSEADEASSE